VDLTTVLAMLGAVTCETATKPHVQTAAAIAALLQRVREMAETEHIRKFATRLELAYWPGGLSMTMRLKSDRTCSVYVTGHHLVVTLSAEDKFDNSSGITVDLAAPAVYAERLTELAQFILRREARSGGT